MQTRGDVPCGRQTAGDRDVAIEARVPPWLHDPLMSDTRVPVLLYDGECRLCNGVVRFMLRHDRLGRIRFAPLQGPSGQAYLRSRGLPTGDFGSLVFVPDWRDPAPAAPLMRTTGALAAFAELGGPWRHLALLRRIPAPLRDPLYWVVARTRTLLFGAHRPAPLADPSWGTRFLDGPPPGGPEAP
jgi:predicted DCC family thiol-disulfide oxidoreductase YuxK